MKYRIFSITQLLPPVLVAIAALTVACNLPGSKTGTSGAAPASANAGGAGTGGGSTTTISTTVVASANISTTIANRLLPRKFIATTLDDIFGPTATAVTATMISPVGNNFLLGGPCDNNDIDCPNDVAEDTQAPLVPPTIAGRAALVTRTCDLILSTDAPVRYAVAQVRGESLTQNFADPTSADLNPPSSTELQVAYDLFYSGKVPDATVITQLQAVVTQAKTVATAAGVNPDLDAWRFTFLTLCLAPDWQIP